MIQSEYIKMIVLIWTDYRGLVYYILFYYLWFYELINCVKNNALVLENIAHYPVYLRSYSKS